MRRSKAGLWAIGGVVLVAVTASVTAFAVSWVSPTRSQQLSIVGSAASIFALVQSYWYQRSSKLLVDSLPTRYLGEFPNFHGEIVNVLEKAKSEIVVVCDFPSYGHYSLADEWLPYSHALQIKKERNVNITAVFMSREKRASFSHKQFFEKEPNQREWSGYIKMHRDEISGILRRHGRMEAPSELTPTGLLELLELDDQDALNGTFGKTCPIQTHESLPVYMWISDRSHCVFAFPTYEAGTRSEYGFVTRDPKLIDSIYQVLASLKDRPPVPGYQQGG